MRVFNVILNAECSGNLFATIFIGNAVSNAVKIKFSFDYVYDEFLPL